MGTKYSTNATSGYNSLPPSDDGTVSEANKVKYSTLKTKLADPIKTLADTINSELVTHFNNGPSAVTANTTLGASHYNQVIQASGAAVTLTLSDAATLLAGWYCWVRNTDTTESITIGRATAGDTFNGTAANYSLKPNEAIMIVCNAAANGFITVSLALGDSQTLSGARFNIENAAPWIDFRETDQTLPAGKVRIYANGDTWQIEKNTVTAGDYSTSVTSLRVNANGSLTSLSPSLNLETSAPIIDFRETTQTLPAGKFRIIGNGDTFALEKNTVTAGDYSTNVQSILVNADGTTTVNFAPGSVSTAALADASVSQVKLKTTTAAGSQAIGAGTSVAYALTGGTYSWWTASGAGNGVDGFVFSHGDTAAGVLGVMNVNGVSQTFYHDERYIQASPPYNWGPCFVFLAVDTLGNIKHARVSNDPPWAYHGPTDITPQYHRNGKSYRAVKMIDGVPLRAAIKNAAIRDRLLRSEAVVSEREVEITLDYKDSDKGVMPHWFLGNDLTGLTVVMLEPGTVLMQRFADFCDDSGARDVLHDILLAGRLSIGNTSLGLPGAPVMCVHARLK